MSKENTSKMKRVKESLLIPDLKEIHLIEF